MMGILHHQQKEEVSQWSIVVREIRVDSGELFVEALTETIRSVVSKPSLCSSDCFQASLTLSKYL